MNDLQSVYIVDDDDAMRESMSLMLEQSGFRVRTFPSAPAFLAGASPEVTGCLVLDLRMPGMNGLELQRQLGEAGFRLPVIFLSAYGDVPTTVTAIKGGAVDFLEKPVARRTLVERILHAFDEDRRQRAAEATTRIIRDLYDELTPRERQVMMLVTRGLANKEIAQHLGISPRTVENHRARVMEKMQAENIAELVQMASLCPLSDETEAPG